MHDLQNASAHIDVANRTILALVVVRFGGRYGQRHRAHTSHKHHGHIQELCPIPFSRAVTPTDRPTVPKAEQDSKMASMTDTASEVL